MPTHHAHLSRRNNKTSTQHAQATKIVASPSRFRKCSRPELHPSTHPLSQLGFIKPDPGRLLCPLENCGRRYTQAKNLYKHYRRKSDALHKKLAETFGGRCCDICHEDFKRLYDWERHMKKEHKSSTPIVKGLVPSGSTPQFARLQLRRRDVGINPAVPDLRLSTEQVKPHQPCRSGISRPAPFIEVFAHSSKTDVTQTGGLFPDPDLRVYKNVQSTKENSANWHDTVINPRNNHGSSRNHQLFLSKGRDLAYALGLPLENTDFSTVYLPVLLYSLGCSRIREDVLYRGIFLQKRWDKHGNVQQVTLRDCGFDEQVACLFLSKIRLAQVIESCIQLGLIVVDVLVDDSRKYSLSDQSRHHISESFEPAELSLLGLMFTAHIYPRDQTLESS